MIKVVNVTRCKCESCGITVNENNKYCSECGKNLQNEVKYEEIPRNNITRKQYEINY